jgi:hypothetical protein
MLSEVVIVALVSRPTADVVSKLLCRFGIQISSRLGKLHVHRRLQLAERSKNRRGVSGGINSPSRWNDMPEPKQNAAVDAVSQHMCREESRNGYFLFRCMQFREVNQM